MIKTGIQNSKLPPKTPKTYDFRELFCMPRLLTEDFDIGIFLQMDTCKKLLLTACRDVVVAAAVVVVVVAADGGILVND